MSGDIYFFLEHGITPETFDVLTKAAECIVENGEPEQVFLVLFNQVVNQSKRNNIDYLPLFTKMIHELQSRIDSPH